MEQSQLRLVLERLGLSEKEAALYLASLQSGPAGVQQLSRVSGVKRTSVYHVVEGLLARGLIRKEVHGAKEVLVPKEPESLERLLEEQRQDFLDTLPYLQSLHSQSGSNSVIRYFEGLEKVEEAYWEMLDVARSGDDYLVLGNMESWMSMISEKFVRDFLRKRSRLPIQVRMIVCDGPQGRSRKEEDRLGNERTRILPASSMLGTNLVILPRRVFVHQYEAPYIGMLIENEHIIRMHREMYEIMWSGLAD